MMGFYELMTYLEPRARRINAQQAESLYASLPRVVRWGLKNLYPYIAPPSVIAERGFRAPPGMYFDNSLAAARLRSLALRQIERLWEAKRQGCKIIGLAQDAGQLLPFFLAGKKLAWFSFDTLGALYAATSRERTAFQAAEQAGVRRESCPVIKACVGLLHTGRIPTPDLIVAQTGSSCDDHAVQMQLKAWLGYPVYWLELPYRRSWQPYFSDEKAYAKDNRDCQRHARVFYQAQLRNLQSRLEEICGAKYTAEDLQGALRKINRFRQTLRRLFHRISVAKFCPWPAVDQLLLHVAAMDGYGDFEETQAIADYLERVIAHRERRGMGVLPGELPSTPHILWMLPVLDMNLPGVLENAGARVTGWEMPHLAAYDYDTNMAPLAAMSTDYLRFTLLGDCRLRLKWLADFLARYRVDGIIYSALWSCTQMPLQAGIVKDFLRNYNIPMLILDCGSPGELGSGQMRTRIEAFAENLRG
ncbi:MAG TPA: 2-hydroxyacyl-CoA dehydratase family protein [Negativicutes bacterium]|nr:2-hydroxyacyl-CoA dehydratase family protein [Negativicutes bacterium]